MYRSRLKMKKASKKTILTALTAVMLLSSAMLSSCGISSSKQNSIVFKDGSVSSSADGVKTEGNTATITKSGSYTLTGTGRESRLVIDTQELGDIFLYIDGLDLTCSSDAPVEIRKAENVYFMAYPGDSSKITDGRELNEYEADAAIYGKCDMFFQGEGELTVISNNTGIHSSDDIKIKSGTLNVTAGEHGIKGKDKVKIDGGTINVDAGKDGIKSTKTDSSKKGVVDVNGGNITIKCADDGISASNEVRLQGGSIVIDTQNNGVKATYSIECSNGVTVDITTADNGLNAPKITGDGTAKVTVNGESVDIK